MGTHEIKTNTHTHTMHSSQGEASFEAQLQSPQGAGESVCQAITHSGLLVVPDPEYKGRLNPTSWQRVQLRFSFAPTIPRSACCESHTVPTHRNHQLAAGGPGGSCGPHLPGCAGPESSRPRSVLQHCTLPLTVAGPWPTQLLPQDSLRTLALGCPPPPCNYVLQTFVFPPNLTIILNVLSKSTPVAQGSGDITDLLVDTIEQLGSQSSPSTPFPGSLQRCLDLLMPLCFASKCSAARAEGQARNQPEVPAIPVSISEPRLGFAQDSVPLRSGFGIVGPLVH